MEKRKANAETRRALRKRRGEKGKRKIHHRGHGEKKWRVTSGREERRRKE